MGQKARSGTVHAQDHDAGFATVHGFIRLGLPALFSHYRTCSRLPHATVRTAEPGSRRRRLPAGSVLLPPVTVILLMPATPGPRLTSTSGRSRSRPIMCGWRCRMSGDCAPPQAGSILCNRGGERQRQLFSSPCRHAASAEPEAPPADRLPLTRLDAMGILRRLRAGRSRSGNSRMIAWTSCLSTLRCLRKSGME